MYKFALYPGLSEVCVLLRFCADWQLDPLF